jgi:hypothetical protein
MPFKALGLHPLILQAIRDTGYTEPTPIQSAAIPEILLGNDIIGIAQTGTGKTAAFALPLLSKLEKHGKLRCLVLEPTRELASQVEEAFKDYSRFFDVEVGMVQGGVGFGKGTGLLLAQLLLMVERLLKLLQLLQATVLFADIESESTPDLPGGWQWMGDDLDQPGRTRVGGEAADVMEETALLLGPKLGELERGAIVRMHQPPEQAGIRHQLRRLEAQQLATSSTHPGINRAAIGRRRPVIRHHTPAGRR